MRAALLVALLLAGCDEEIQVGRGRPRDPTQAIQADAGPPDAGITTVSFSDESFAESESNRDPFRNYASVYVVRPMPMTGETTRPVKLPDTGLDEMHVIGIVSGVENPYAMVIDRNGVGHTIRRGEYIGRSEVVQAGGTEGLPVTLNWRVDRIRPGEVVLTREDPTAPNRPPLTRVLSLREEEPAAQGAR
ncbi:MAG: hypothetical protein IT378_02095 [Sandaracinaceae bacterium]|nr:hypothetical protein [Sandaracinaceae bacterium]